jgi:hypothetical protein
MAGGLLQFRSGLARHGGWRPVAVLVVKLMHSLIFLSVSASILHIFYAGITNRTSRWTIIALGPALGESAVFAANRFRCPLRLLAEELGAESGQVTDIFLPRWFADRIPWFFTPLLVIGMLGLIRNHARTARRGCGSESATPRSRELFWLCQRTWNSIQTAVLGSSAHSLRTRGLLFSAQWLYRPATARKCAKRSGHLRTVTANGADGGIRTLDLLFTKQLLYH